MLLLKEIQSVQNRAICLFDNDTVEKGIRQLATVMSEDLKTSKPIFICIMNGGLQFTANLTKNFNFPLQLDYLHLSRYQGELMGSEVIWYAKPQISLKDRTVVLLDDILDVGISLESAKAFCKEQGAAKILSAVLVKKKLKDNKQIGNTDYFVFECPDVYVFGYGMDYKNYLRNLNAIYALNENEQERVL